MKFNEVVGHKEVKEKLLRSTQDGRIPHAQLFLGQEGSGNLALALAYIQYISCQQRLPEDSCGECPSCVKIRKLAHPDLHFVYPVVGSDEPGDKIVSAFREQVLANPYMIYTDWMQEISDEKNGIINVKQSSSILQKISLKPYESAYKYLVIWMPEKLNVNAANKLLKTIEEPPDKTILILVANNDEKIIPTILSRTQLIRLRKLGDFDMLSALSERYGIGLDKGREIVNIADGNYNSAQKLAEFEDFQDNDFNLFSAWMRACFTMNMKDLAKITDEVAGMSRERQKSFYEYSLHMVRETVAQNNESSLLRVTEHEKNFLLKFARFIHLGNIGEIAGHIEKSVYYIERNAHGKILFMNISLAIAQLLKIKNE